MTNNVYFLPGRKEKLDGELGQILAGNKFKVMGRETDDLLEVKFSEQIEIINSDLEKLKNERVIIVGRSYGAWLLLQSIIESKFCHSKVLLISPVLGKTINRSFAGVIPPNEKTFWSIVEKGLFPPANLRVYTGEDDEQCDYKLALRFGEFLSFTQVFIEKNTGHSISQSRLKEIWQEFTNEKD